MTEMKLERHRDGAIASMVTASIMPDRGVSARTEATRAAGASVILEHLMGGEWGADDYSKQVVGEFLGRVIANAERQGFQPTET